MSDVLTLTDEQASYMNLLSNASAALRKAARDLEQRCHEIVVSADSGLRLAGFEHDVLGQAGREVQHQASARDALLKVHMGIPEVLLMRALTLPGRFGSGYYFSAGEQPETV